MEKPIYMSKEQQPLRKIFNEAVEITDARQRAAYLATACGDDAALRRRIEELIAANDAAGAFLGGEGDTELRFGDRERGLGNEHLPCEVGVADLMRAGERGDERRIERPVATFEP